MKVKSLKKLSTIKRGRFSIEEHLVEFPDKKQTKFFRHISHDVSIIIPLLNKEAVIMVKQYRFGADEVSLEFPMGLTDGQDPQKAASRELIEETGCTAVNWKKIGEFNISPAWNTQKGLVFLASEISWGKSQQEEYERIETVKVDIKDIPALIKKGEITDVSTIASYHLFISNN